MLFFVCDLCALNDTLSRDRYLSKLDADNYSKDDEPTHEVEKEHLQTVFNCFQK